MPEAVGEAPGKVILAGEHAVVYGHRAIALAVDRRTRVRLRSRPGPSGIDHSAIADPRLWPALATLLPAEGVGLSIESELPVGCGLGSSAALSVALIRALARAEGREAELEELVEKGFRVERVFHGNPSGVDHTVAAMGGAVLYRRGEAPVRLRLGRPLRLVIANTGTPGNTAEMVAGVRARGHAAEIAAIGALVEEVARAVEAGGPIGALLRENHRLLRAIGVSTPRLDAVAAAMEAAGAAGAKLAGAGGGGVVLALVEEAAPVMAAAAALGCEAFAVEVPEG